MCERGQWLAYYKEGSMEWGNHPRGNYKMASLDFVQMMLGVILKKQLQLKMDQSI